MEAATKADPIWEVLDHQGRSVTWLAEATGRPRWYLNDVKRGVRVADAAFRTASAKVLGVPEHLLFLSSERPFGRTDNNHKEKRGSA